jgi:hypothetical protein
MAADSAAKRYSVIQLAQPWQGVAYPAADSAEHRAANLKLYAFAAGEVDFGGGSTGAVRSSVSPMGRGMLSFSR